MSQAFVHPCGDFHPPDLVGSRAEPVPTLPVSGTAILLLVLLGGALLVIKVA